MPGENSNSNNSNSNSSYDSNNNNKNSSNNNNTDNNNNSNRTAVVGLVRVGRQGSADGMDGRVALTAMCTAAPLSERASGAMALSTARPTSTYYARCLPSVPQPRAVLRNSPPPPLPLEPLPPPPPLPPAPPAECTRVQLPEFKFTTTTTTTAAPA